MTSANVTLVLMVAWACLGVLAASAGYELARAWKRDDGRASVLYFLVCGILGVSAYALGYFSAACLGGGL